MVQTRGILPEVTENDKKLLLPQIIPTAPRKPRKKVKKVKLPGVSPGVEAEVPNMPTDLAAPMKANSTAFSSVEPMMGGTLERRTAARRKAGR